MEERRDEKNVDGMTVYAMVYICIWEHMYAYLVPVQTSSLDIPESLASLFMFPVKNVKVPDRIAIFTQFGACETVAPVRPPVPKVLDVKVFKPGLLHDLEVVQSTSWPDCGDWTMLLAVLEPAATR